MFFAVRRLFEGGLALLRPRPDRPIDQDCSCWVSGENDRRLLLRLLRSEGREADCSADVGSAVSEWGPGVDEGFGDE